MVPLEVVDIFVITFPPVEEKETIKSTMLVVFYHGEFNQLYIIWFADSVINQIDPGKALLGLSLFNLLVLLLLF